MVKKGITPYILIGITVILGILAVVLAQRIYQFRNESIAPTAPKSKPKAVDEQPSSQCTVNFSLQAGPTNTPTITPTATITPTPGGPTATVTPTAPPGATDTPTPGPTSAPLSCNSTCDTNHNKCPSDAPYCVDYSTDSIGPICGRQQLASEGPKCETPPPGCGQTCDVNNNKCTSDSPYCVDYSTDSIGPICGRQSLASGGPLCQTAEVPTPTPIAMPPAGTVENTIFAIVGGMSLIIAGFLFL